MFINCRFDVYFFYYRCKNSAKANQELKHYLKDILLKNMSIELHKVNQNESNSSVRNSNVVYYIAGYLVFAYKRKKATRCQECLKTLEVPSDEFDADNFSAQDFTKLKNRGGLRFASTPFFSLLQQVEKVINDFCSQGKIFC